MNTVKKVTILIRMSILALLCSFVNLGYSQTTVNSLQELLSYMDDNNANVKLAAGTYTIDDSNIDDFGNPILLFSGNNSTFDFTGVTINFDPEVFFAFGNVSVEELAIEGNDNVLKNLTMVDIGTVDDRPRRTALGIRMDGEDNLVEGFNMTVRGSYPYGYGDAFGKGSGYVIKHYKHSAILVRGNHNHVKNCDILHRSYGHGIFMQGAEDAIIEGCTLEGETRTTDDMLAEAGSDSPADLENFITVWGYELPAGYTMSLHEDGIRAYNSGTTIINGQTYEDRRTSDITVINCTVKNMRDGISLALGDGDKKVEGCTVLGCESGYTLSSGTEVINCKGDAVHGPVYRNIYGRSGIDVDIELLPSDSYYNGSKAVAYLGGGNNNITLSSSETNIPEGYQILVGGALDDIRFKNGHLDYQHNHPVSNTSLDNHSGFPIFIPSISDDNDIRTCGEVTDNGSDNSISSFENCEIISVCGNFDAFSSIQGEDFCDTKGGGIAGENSIGSLFDGDWAVYNGVNFSNKEAKGVEIIVGKAHEGATQIEVLLDDLNGESLAILDVPNTGGWYTWEPITALINGVTGKHDIYLLFKNSDPSTGVSNVDSFRFIENASCITDRNAFSLIEAEDYCEMYGIEVEESSENGDNIGFVHDNDFVKYANIDFGNETTGKFEARVASKNGGTLEVRLDGLDGELVASMPVDNTGGWQSWMTIETETSFSDGMHDVYLVFKGGDGYLFNVNYFRFSESVVTGIEQENALEINWYPNPVKSDLHIPNCKGCTLELFDIQGQKLKTENINDEEGVILLDDLTAGIYTVRLSKESTFSLLKLVKE